MYHLIIFDFSAMSYKSLKLFTFFWDTLYLFDHLFDKEPLDHHFSTLQIEADKGKYQADVRTSRIRPIVE